MLKWLLGPALQGRFLFAAGCRSRSFVIDIMRHLKKRTGGPAPMSNLLRFHSNIGHASIISREHRNNDQRGVPNVSWSRVEPKPAQKDP